MYIFIWIYVLPAQRFSLGSNKNVEFLLFVLVFSVFLWKKNFLSFSPNIKDKQEMWFRKIISEKAFAVCNSKKVFRELNCAFFGHIFHVCFFFFYFIFMLVDILIHFLLYQMSFIHLEEWV